MATDKEPLIIYRDILIPLMETAGFLLEFNASDNSRYHTRFAWKSSYVETCVSSEYYGQTRQFESHVDVIGIPMGRSFLILHGIIVGSLSDEYDDVKLKIRCLPRNKSLSISSTESSPNQLTNFSSSLEKNSFDEEEFPEECRERIRITLLNDFVNKLIEMFSVRLDHLPVELKLKILALLPLKSIVSMASVSTFWRELTLDDQLWRLMVKKFFPDVFRQREIGQSWKALFKDQFRRQRVLEKRRAFAARENHRFIPALPPSPPLLPIMPPPYYPMVPVLPPPPTFMRELMHQNPFADSFWEDDRDSMGRDIPLPRPLNNPYRY